MSVSLDGVRHNLAGSLQYGGPFGGAVVHERVGRSGRSASMLAGRSQRAGTAAGSTHWRHAQQGLAGMYVTQIFTSVVDQMLCIFLY